LIDGLIDDGNSVGSNENGDGIIDGAIVGSFNGDIVETIQVVGFNSVGLVVVGMNNVVGSVVKDGDIVSDFQLLG
jgi:hypothetical protein